MSPKVLGASWPPSSLQGDSGDLQSPGVVDPAVGPSGVWETGGRPVLPGMVGEGAHWPPAPHLANLLILVALLPSCSSYYFHPVSPTISILFLLLLPSCFSYYSLPVPPTTSILFLLIFPSCFPHYFLPVSPTIFILFLLLLPSWMKFMESKILDLLLRQEAVKKLNDSSFSTQNITSD